MNNMKSYVLIVCILLSNIISYAQNFHLLDSSTAKLYKNSSNGLHAIYIDSVVTIPNTTTKLYYNYKQDVDDLSDLNNKVNMCDNYSINTWLGEKVTYTGNDTYIFKNLNNESIVLKTNLNADPWKIIEYSANKYLLAKVNVLLSSDSMLYIDLVAKTDTMDTTFNAVNNKQIIISKKLGFIKVFDFRVFPRKYSPMLLYKSILKPNWNDTIGVPSIFNYKVGDIIQYKGSNVYIVGHDYRNDRFYQSIEILEKNTAGYKIRIRDIRLYYSSGVTKNSFTVNTKNISYPINNNVVLPYKRIKVVLSKYDFNNKDKYAVVLYEIDSVFARISRKHLIYSCYNSQNFPFQTKNYIQGIGVFDCNSYGSSMEPNFTHDTTLIYYKSDNVEFGDSIDFRNLYGSDPVGIQNNEKESYCKVFPNPASNIINILSFDMFEKISVLNVDGRIVLDNIKENIINIEELPNGIYLVKAVSPSGKIYSSRFIKN